MAIWLVNVYLKGKGDIDKYAQQSAECRVTALAGSCKLLVFLV